MKFQAQFPVKHLKRNSRKCLSNHVDTKNKNTFKFVTQGCGIFSCPVPPLPSVVRRNRQTLPTTLQPGWGLPELVCFASDLRCRKWALLVKATGSLETQFGARDQTHKRPCKVLERSWGETLGNTQTGRGVCFFKGLVFNKKLQEVKTGKRGLFKVKN